MWGGGGDRKICCFFRNTLPASVNGRCKNQNIAAENYNAPSDKNRIHHRSPIQTEKSQPEGERLRPETRFTYFPALSIDPRVGVSRSASETNV